MLITRFAFVCLVFCSAALSAQPASAQNLFAPAIEVNESIITRFEIAQRRALLQLLSPAQASEEQAREGLIEDRLRMQAVDQFGFTPTEADIETGMEEFAARGQLELPAFLELLAAREIAVETFRDFVAVGAGWRDLVRARFGNRVQVSSADIDRALAASGQNGSLRVLLSEIIIPAPPAQEAEVLALAEEIAQVKSFDAFSQAAQRFSATASRDQGGRLDWRPITSLPAPLRPILLGLSRGEVTDPIPLENAIALFQLRGIQESTRAAPRFAAIEFARYYIPGGRTPAALAQAADIRNEVDVCDDLYGIAKGQPEEHLARDTLPPSEIPSDISFELAKLDENEVSTALVTADGTALVFLMLCGRTAELSEDVSREAIAENLRQQRFAAFADGYLEQLRADARIRTR